MKKKTIALLLGMAMLFAAFAPGVFAEEANTSTPAPTETPVETPVETPTVTPTDAPAGDATAEPTAPTTTEPTTQPTTEPTVEPTETPVVCTCEGTEEEKAAEGFKHNEGCPLYVAPAEPTPAVSYENLPVEELYALLGTMEAEAAAAVRASLSADKQAALTEYEGKLAYAEFYKALMDCTTLAEVQALVAPMSQTEAEAFMNALTPEEAEALAAHIQELAAQEPREIPETVNFTDAGPFMPPVYVGGFLRRSAARAAATEGDEENGLILSKNAVAKGDGSYTITLDAYVTGNVVTTTTTIPVDIVLVLDQSGSMAYGFDGNKTNIDTERRQYAMKQAVNSFIEKVNEKYDAKSADHRMAIVTYGNSASVWRDWTTVNGEGKNTLQGKINDLRTPSGATNVAAGMAQAEYLMGSDGYNYNGNNTNRQKVVIVFTDGVPTRNRDFDTDVANTAIASAKNLKYAGVTVYSVGIFNGANPAQLHGDKWDYMVYDDIPCTGEVDSYWGSSWAASLFGRNDFEPVDVPAGNRFLNYLSSNFMKAENIGVDRGLHNPGDEPAGWGTGYEINQNFNRDASDYYLTAVDSSKLSEIFQSISEQIGGATMQLDSTTVVQDVVSQYFTIPEDATVSLYTADCTGADGSGNLTFGSRTTATGVTAVIDSNTSNTVRIDGFDYATNYCGTKTDASGNVTYHGKKLIIEFTVTPKSGFLGGNGVPTNGADSGVYAANSDTPIGTFDVPTVNVPIPEVTVTAQNKNVYLLQVPTDEQLKEGAVIKCGNVDITDPSSLEDWQKAYVNIETPTVAKSNGFNATADGTYTITATVSPKTEGTAVTAQTATSPDAKINVFKPELTFKDSEVYYGADVPADFSGNLTNTEWKHGDTLDTAQGVTMTDDDAKPTLGITYTPDSTKIADSKINTKQDIGVDVAVKIGDNDVNAHTTFKHTPCTDETCGWTVPTNPGDPAFLLHVQTCQLTITKSGGAAGEPYVFNIYKDGSATPYTQASITGNDSVNIYELPVGTYTIEEDTDWSWRYTPSDMSAVILNSTNAKGTVTCDNTKSALYWLNGFSSVVKNIFGVPKDATPAN